MALLTNQALHTKYNTKTKHSTIIYGITNTSLTVFLKWYTYNYFF